MFEQNSYNYADVHKKKKGSGRTVVFLFLSALVILALLFAASSYLVLDNIGRLPEQFQLDSIFKNNKNSETDQPLQSEVPKLTINTEPISEDELSTASIAKLVTPQTVAVFVYQGAQMYGGGSGIIMNDEGYIITNAHVIEDATSVKVMLSDDVTYDCKIIGADHNSDLAVVKLTDVPKNLQPVSFGDSSALEIGEKVVAIGSPGGLSGTVTQGVVSGTNRTREQITGIANDSALALIQTDAAINPGNSGGPLVNRFGQVIGVTSSKIARVDYEGIGFAIPISEALPIITTLIEKGSLPGRAVIGITIAPVSLLNSLPVGYTEEYGLFITEINTNSDLHNYGITPGDIMMEADSKQLFTTDDLSDIIATKAIGDTINLVVWKSTTARMMSLSAVLVDSNG